MHSMRIMDGVTIPERRKGRGRVNGTYRANITCSQPLYSAALHLVEDQGFRTFSGYIEFLIRLDLERRKSQRPG